MDEQTFNTLYHYSERLTRDPDDRNELVLMAWQQSTRSKRNTSIPIMINFMKLRSRELKKRCAFGAKACGKSIRDVWARDKVYIDRPTDHGYAVRNALSCCSYNPLSMTIVHDFENALRANEEAVADRLIAGYTDQGKNPFTHVDKLIVEERRLFLMDQEVEKILNYINEDIRRAEGPGARTNVIVFRKTFKMFVEFLLNTGLRRNEALNLRMDHIDMVRNVIYIEKAKGKQMRAVPLNRPAKDIILTLGDGLFSKLNENDVTNKFRYYLEKTDLKGFKLHSLRHTFATRLLALGVDLYTISRLLGHSDMKTSMIYAKTNIETLRSVVEKLDKSCYAIVTRGDFKDKGQ